ncbi:MAG: rRNA methyltransferase [Frankiales bacterium]|nr:rRNA methyltransferase [Frankiales bacterium]
MQVEGFHAVKHALRFAPDLITSITVTSIDGALALCAALAPDVAELLLEIAVVGEVEHPTGVTGTADKPMPDRSVLSSRTTPLVLLDHPRHAGNAGAVVRVAAAAGASGVAVLGPMDLWHPAVIRGAAGLQFALPVMPCWLEDVQGPVYALHANGQRVGALPDDAVLAVGSEREGLSPRVLNRADHVISLPMEDGVSSLNLATAVSAMLYSWRLARP